MPNDQISMRQMMTLLFAALLSPVVRVLPARTAALAGEAGWLSALLALPVMLLLCWILLRLMGRGAAGTGLSEAFQTALGDRPGKLLTVGYLLWGVFLLCANTRLFGLRFLSTGYRNAPLGLLIVVLLAVVLWLARKKLSAFARTGEIFYLALAVVLGVTLALGSFHIAPGNVLPIWVEDVPDALRAVPPTLSVLGYGVFAAFLGGSVTRTEGGGGRCMRWTAAFCLVLTALQLVCLGNFGPALTARLDTPFFMMAKSIGVPGAFERVESVVLALWVLSDLAFVALLVFSCCTMAQSVFGLKERKTAALPVVLVTLLGALLLFPSAFALSQLMESVVLYGNLAMGFAVPAAVLVIGRLRRLV